MTIQEEHLYTTKKVMVSGLRDIKTQNPKLRLKMNIKLNMINK